MQISKKRRNIIAAAAVFLACLLAFFVFWKLAKPVHHSLTATQCLSGEAQHVTEPLPNVPADTVGILPDIGDSRLGVVQQFTCDTAFYAVKAVPVFEGGAPAGIMCAYLFDGDGNLLDTSVQSTGTLVSGEYVTFGFEQSVSAPGGVYQIYFMVSLDDPAASIALATTGSVPSGWVLSTGEGALCLAVSVESVASFIAKWYWLIAAAAALVMAAAVWLVLTFIKSPFKARRAAPEKRGEKMATGWARFTGFVKKHRSWLASAGVLVLCLLVFFVYWKLEVAEARGKSQSEYLNDNQQTATQPLQDGAMVEQTFTTDQPFLSLGVAPTFAGDPPAGHMWLAVYDSAGNLLGEAQGGTDTAASGSYAVFVFPDVISSPDNNYRLVFTAQTQDPDVDYSLLKSGQALAGWTLAEDGQPAEGSLCLRISTQTIGSFLTRWYWAFALLGSLFGALLCFFALRGTKPHRLFALAAAGLGLLFSMVMPPYSAPDEQFHINQAYNLSSFILGEAPYQAEWGTNYRRADDNNAAVEDQQTTVFTYREIADGFFERSQDTTTVIYAGEEVGPPRLYHLPAALGITLCRLLGFGFVATLYVGRLVNLALYIFMAALAVKLAPRGRAVFAVVGLLPMSMHMAASYNRDGLLIGLFMLFTALCLHYALGTKRMGLRDYLLLAALIFVAAPAKAVYLPALLLVLFIPAARFGWRGQPLPKSMALLAKGALMAVGVASLVGFLGGTVVANAAQTVPGAVITLPGLSVLAAGANTAPAGLAGVFAPMAAQAVQTYTLTDFLTAPGTMLWLILRTIAQQLVVWVQTGVGGNLGYYNTEISWGYVVFFVLLLAAAALPAPKDSPLDTRRRAGMLILAFASAGLLVLACVLWTPVGEPTIYGIQGRYFLPVVPLALCALGSKKSVIRPSKELTVPLVTLSGLGGVFALLNVFLVILAR